MHIGYVKIHLDIGYTSKSIYVYIPSIYTCLYVYTYTYIAKLVLDHFSMSRTVQVLACWLACRPEDPAVLWLSYYSDINLCPG